MNEAPAPQFDEDDFSPGDPWWEDPELAAAVAEVEEFAAAAGWERPSQLFALVASADLRAAQPELPADHLSSGRFTPVAQDPLPSGGLGDALARIAWPDAVAGCVLVQEIVVLPPSAAAGMPDDPDRAAQLAAEHPERTEARLTAGVLRDAPGGSCLLRIRGQEAPLHGGNLAPNVLGALHATFTE